MAQNRLAKVTNCTLTKSDKTNLKRTDEHSFSSRPNWLLNCENTVDNFGSFNAFYYPPQDMELANLNSRSSDESSIYTVNKEKINRINCNAVTLTPVSQKQDSPVGKRWASVVKAQKNIQNPKEPNLCESKQDNVIEISSDLTLHTFPKSLENHKVFISRSENLYSCIVCSLELITRLSLSNHLKTRKHEDNVINYLKEKMPPHLHKMMEFISFYGSDLCCNLCQRKIIMSSENCYETILNIIAHNSDEDHTIRKTNHVNSNYAHAVLQLLAANHPEIKRSLHFIDEKVNPQFKCKICKQNIPYDENVEILAQNFVFHLRSIDHTKNQRAFEVLELFRETSAGIRDNFVAVNGNIYCTYCKLQVETDVAKLLSHVNSNHAKVVPALSCVKIINPSLQEIKVQDLKPVTFWNTETHEKKQIHDSNLISLSDYLIKNDKGSVTCLICNRVVPPNTYNLQTHVLGNSHKTNKEIRKIASENIGSKCFNNILTTHSNTEKLDMIPFKTTKNQSDLMQSITENVGNINGILKNNNSIITCLLCQCTINPTSDHLFEHLTSLQHKQRVKLLPRPCPNCPKSSMTESSILKHVPKSLHSAKCLNVNPILSHAVSILFDLLKKKNPLMLENEDFLVKNVDGKHSYCKLCKNLIPLSLDLDVLENNVISHFTANRHKAKVLEQEKKNSVFPKHANSSFGKVARCLFNATEIDKNPLAYTKTQTNRSFSNIDCPSQSSVSLITMDSKNKPEKEKCNDNQNKNVPELFLFHKEKNGNQSTFEHSKKQYCIKENVKSALKYEEEIDEEVLNRRQKQIDYGKNTEGYSRYCQEVPWNKRTPYQPTTPPKNIKCSRRNWDGMVRAWRRMLHEWDPLDAET